MRKNKIKKILFFKIFSILNVEQKKKLKFGSEREARAEEIGKKNIKNIFFAYHFEIFQHIECVTKNEIESAANFTAA